MTWFGLDPQSIVDRAQTSDQPPHLPTLGWSVSRGAIRFTLVSIGGFAPWAFEGGRLARQFGEGGLYALCAIVFMGLSGLLMHRLIAGKRSLRRFYRLFTVAFLAYAIVWCAVWFGVRIRYNDYLGLALGTAAFGWIVASAFGARASAMKAIVVVVVLHAVGYALGGWLYSAYKTHSLLELVGVILDSPTRSATARLLWGIGYGAGFGAGIGYLFHECQAEARTRLANAPTAGAKQ